MIYWRDFGLNIKRPSDNALLSEVSAVSLKYRPLIEEVYYSTVTVSSMQNTNILFMEFSLAICKNYTSVVSALPSGFSTHNKMAIVGCV